MTDWVGTLFPIATSCAAGWLVGGWRWGVFAVLALLTLRSEVKP